MTDRRLSTRRIATAALAGLAVVLTFVSVIIVSAVELLEDR